MRSRSTLFLMEQLIVSLVFAVCATVCVSIFVDSYIMARDAKALSSALLIARNGAESYKESGGKLASISLDLGSSAEIMDGSLTVYYDKDWHPCEQAEAVYVLHIINYEPAEGVSSVLSGDLSVARVTGEEIIAFPVATRRINFE
jgi:hypothetical protein